MKEENENGWVGGQNGWKKGRK